MPEIYDYIDSASVSPDYNATLSVSPQRVVWEEADPAQEIIKGDDNSEVVVEKADKADFFVRLVWDNISDADSDTIFDFFYDSSKANRYARSFKWAQPRGDSTEYTVRFASVLRRGRLETTSRVAEITLHILGVAP